MGLLQYKTKPDIIICEYEMNTEDEIDIITGCGQDDIKKLKIYVLKKKLMEKIKDFRSKTMERRKNFQKKKLLLLLKMMNQ